MTPDQQMIREERVAIMVYDGGCSEEEAQQYCDRYPLVYGLRDITVQQGDLFTIKE